LFHVNEKLRIKCLLTPVDHGFLAIHKAKRTTHRSSKGTKLYAVRDSNGRFKDIQTYKRAHSADIKRKSKSEA
jgi:hypothetical protein